MLSFFSHIHASVNAEQNLQRQRDEYARQRGFVNSEQFLQHQRDEHARQRGFANSEQFLQHQRNAYQRANQLLRESQVKFQPRSECSKELITDELEECCVCLDKTTQFKIIHDDHKLCDGCFSKLYQNGICCPLCRFEAKKL